MPIDHKAKPGDCVCTVAIRQGLDPKTVWELQENQKLRERTDVAPDAAPEILNPGDNVHLPDRKTRWESRADSRYHPFKVKTIPLRLRLRFLDQGEPRANLNYTLQIDGKKSDGALDANGLLDEPLPPLAADVRVRLGDTDSGEDYFIKLGHIDPVGRVSGIQQRLHNLGYDPGPIDGIFGPLTRHALTRFQVDQQIPADPGNAAPPGRNIFVAAISTGQSGQPDNPTLTRLAEVHGC